MSWYFSYHKFLVCSFQGTSLTVLSVIRNQNSFDLWSLVNPASIFHHISVFLFYEFGSHLLSHTVSSAVSSAALVLTVVFGMGTGVSPKRIATRNLIHFSLLHSFLNFGNSTVKHIFSTLSSLERRWSSRTFRYGYLVTTSPQLSVPP